MNPASNGATTVPFCVYAAAAILVSLSSAQVAARDLQLSIVRDGAFVSCMILADNPTRAAQLAAFELQRHLKLITGADVPVVREAGPTDGTRILVGASAATEKQGLKNDSLKPQEYIIRFAPGTLVLMGRDKEDFAEVKYGEDDPFAFGTWPDLFDEQGTLYAVYDFLERFCNVRWFNPTELGIDYPQTKNLTVKGTEVRRSPAFEYRDIGWPMGMSEVYNMVTGLWPPKSPQLDEADALGYADLKRKYPGGWQYVHAKRGMNRLFLHRMRAGGVKYQANHSFYGYYDRFWAKSADPKAASVFVGSKPEWFAHGYDNKPPQMCYTNPEFIQQVTQDARDYFDGKDKLQGAVASGDYFALVPMDNSAYCKCDKCQARMDSEEAKSPFFSNGYASDYVFGFANEVARAVKQTHPGKRLATLAYADYAYYPKRVRLESNIAVQLCLHMRNTYATELQQNDVKFYDSWVTKEKDRPIFLWLYYCFPAEVGHGGGWNVFPGFFAHRIERWFKRFHRDGIRSAFFNGFGQEVEAFVTFKLLDDPTRDVDQLLDEYFARYYGAAAKPMKSFYLTVEGIYGDPGNYPRLEGGKILGHQSEEMAWKFLGTPERMADLGSLVVKARELAKTDTEKRRLALFEKEIWEYMKTGPYRTVVVEHLEFPDRGVELQRIMYRQPEMSGDDAAQGREFILETEGSYFNWGGKTIFHKGNTIVGLTDGDVAESLFFHHSQPMEVTARCELGEVTAEGRELRQIRLCWTMEDSQRSRANIKFAVRDAKAQDWRDVTGFLQVDQWEGAKADCYRVLTVSFPSGAVTNFDAVRLIDGAPLAKLYYTRFTEIDVVTGPQK
ncbi:MAG: hypothetical protein CO095_09905 [Armatimonadetes bacterium CG_4_9_14_3_um_filter_58_7]|nr:MAG: hypothetical protein CO095_09905 [Armatimonadetes bacterium CG_4_9_14_3_um_filter_58_7]